tara:strand:- start:120 stop:299 length:180 start_codon:yes stop_codon:yes gene_type:complete
MKYVYYGLAVFAILQALAMSVLFGVILEEEGTSVLLSFLYGAASGSIAGNLLILGWEEK